MTAAQDRADNRERAEKAEPTESNDANEPTEPTDPESPLCVTEAGYRAAGRLVGALGPAVLIQEGGYDLASLGGLAVAALSGAAEGAGLDTPC